MDLGQRGRCDVAQIVERQVHKPSVADSSGKPHFKRALPGFVNDRIGAAFYKERVLTA